MVGRSPEVCEEYQSLTFKVGIGSVKREQHERVADKEVKENVAGFKMEVPEKLELPVGFKKIIVKPTIGVEKTGEAYELPSWPRSSLRRPHRS